MPKPLISIFAGCCILGLLSLAWVAIGWTRADLLIREVRQDLSAWQSQGTELETLAAWEATRDKLDLAIALRPGEPEYHRLKGYLYEWRFRAPETSDGSTLDNDAYQTFYQNTVDQILGAYRDALKLRPVWPYTWAYLARVKGDFDQHDAEFVHAVQQTLNYGKEIDRVQLEVNQLAVRNFAYILQDPLLFPLIRENAQRSFSATPGSVRSSLAYFEATNMLAFACNWVDTSAIARLAQQACQPYLPAQ